MRGREKFRKIRGLISVLTCCYGLFPKKIRLKLFAHYRGTKGNKGVAIRYALLSTLAEKIGENVLIQPDVYILNPTNLSIGNNVSIHPFCYLECIGGVSIGDDVSIAEGSSVISFDHNYSDVNMPIKDQYITRKPITIENNVWIGAKATILGGTAVREGAVVAAGAVVTKDTASFSVVAGVPAKEIKSRKQGGQ